MKPDIDKISTEIYTWANSREVGIMHFKTGYLSAYLKSGEGSINFKGISHNGYLNIQHNVLFWYPLRDKLNKVLNV